MSDTSTPYAEISTLLQCWAEKHMCRDAPELLALQQFEQQRLVDTMATMLASTEIAMRFTAVDALPLLVPKALVITLLVPYLKDPLSSLRWALCEFFHGYSDPQVVLPLVRVLCEDSDANVRLVAAEALCAVGDERAIPALAYAVKYDRGKDYEDRLIADAARDAMVAIEQRAKAKSSL